MASYENIVAIVWDLDGTLIDSAPDLAGALNTLLREHSLPQLGAETVRRMIGNGVAKLIERGFRAVGQTLSGAEIETLQPRFMQIYSGHATDLTRLYPGARQALQGFYEHGIRQAICTNKPERVSHAILESLGLSYFFDIVVGGDTAAHRKPHTLPLRMCLDALSTDKNKSLMVGDSSIDVATAKGVGMPVGIVTHGYSREPVETLGADFLISDLSSLPYEVALQ